MSSAKLFSMSQAPEVTLAQQLVRISSPSCKEFEVMAFMVETFKSLGFDEAYLDEAGNALGVFRRGDGPTVMLNGHLDTVPTGDESLWPQPPLSGEIVNGELWGRGSVDMKSAVAAMACAAKDAVAAGFQGTLIVSAVVQEEIGGLGARHLGGTGADVVILGEPSNLNLMLGHRGRVEVEVTLPGKIAHAAKAENGDNALYHAADLLQKVRGLELPAGGPLGASTITPTNLESYPRESRNVVPGGARLILDYRNIPGDEPGDILAKLRHLAPEARFEVRERTAVSENGDVSLSFADVPPYLCPGENQLVSIARESVKASLKPYSLDLTERVWWFATDAPHLAEGGAPVIGFGPGDENLAHTTNERVLVKHIEISRAVYRDLALAYSQKPAKERA